MNKLSIIIPAYNEEALIKTSLEKLATVDFPIDSEIVVVDDGSTDDTLQIVNNFKEESTKNIVLIRKENGGKGSALREGIKKATGNIITFHDADLEYDPEDLKLLLVELLKSNGKYAVYGSRFIKKNNQWKIPSHYIGNKLLSLAVTVLYLRKVGDMETCYKMFYTSALDGIKLKSKGFDIEPEITTKFLKKGLRIKEVPITYKPRDFEEGKKINYKDGIKALYVIIKNRL